MLQEYLTKEAVVKNTLDCGLAISLFSAWRPFSQVWRYKIAHPTAGNRGGNKKTVARAKSTGDQNKQN